MVVLMNAAWRNEEVRSILKAVNPYFSIIPKAFYRLFFFCLFVFCGVSSAAEKTTAELVKSGGSKIGSNVPSVVNTGSFVQMVFGLVFVIVAIIVLAWLTKKLGGIQRSYGAPMKVIGTLNLGNREKVVVVEIGGTQMVLGVTTTNVQKIHVFDEPVFEIENKEAEVASGSFAMKLQQMLIKNSDKGENK